MINTENFWKKVNVADGCWEWQAYRDRDGYGTFRVGDKKQRAHRVSFAIQNGRFPRADHVLDHLCKNTACVNPNHLEEVLPIVNLMRGDNVAATALRTGKCVRGHSNWKIRNMSNGNTKRVCLDCVVYRNRKKATHG